MLFECIHNCDLKKKSGTGVLNTQKEKTTTHTHIISDAKQTPLNLMQLLKVKVNPQAFTDLVIYCMQMSNEF